MGSPIWATDRQRLWNEVEKREDRSTRPDDAKTQRRLIAAILYELTKDKSGVAKISPEGVPARWRAAGHCPAGQRRTARVFGIDPKTEAKVLRFSVPPGCRRSKPPAGPKLDGFTGVLDRVLEEDQVRPRKQRHTARHVFQRLQAEHGLAGGETIVKTYVRERRLRRGDVRALGP